MNTDDPKLTAFALDELDEPERSMIARTVAELPEGQRVVDETRELARALKNEFAAELNEAPGTLSPNLIDIREESWFWARARPLALAAMVAIFAILGAIVFGNFKAQRDSITASSDRFTEIEAEEPARSEVPSARSHPNEIPNPLRRDVVQRIERVVIGELDVDSQLQSEIRVIETIKDVYRIQRLKERLATPVLSRKSHPGIAGHRYELIFLDRDGHVIASAAFYRVGSSEFVLQPSKYGSESGGHYFPERGDTVLPGNWKSETDYLAYAIPFPDWSECIGYSPGV